MDLSNIQVTEDCIRRASYIGKTVYYNICNDNVHEVIWGSLDWIGCIVLVVCTVGIVALLYKVITDL